MLDCCKVTENRVEIRRERPGPQAPAGVGDLIVRECKVCKRKHYEANVNKGVFNMKGK